MGTGQDEARLRVAVVEHQEMVRRGLSDMLRGVADVRADAFSTFTELFDHADRDDYDVMLVGAELDLPDGDELAARRATGELLVLVPSTDEAHLMMATKWNADGYVMGTELTTPILADALQRVAARDTPMPREVARFLFECARRPRASSVQLTPRESEVLKLIIEGLSNKQIAYRLDVSVHGAKRHVSSIISKLNCTSRAQVVARSLQLQ